MNKNDAVEWICEDYLRSLDLSKYPQYKKIPLIKDVREYSKTLFFPMDSHHALGLRESKILVERIFTETELTEIVVRKMPEVGEWVKVADSLSDQWVSARYLFTVPEGSVYPFRTINEAYESNFPIANVKTEQWKYLKTAEGNIYGV